ncbi:hypothetical protein GQ457_08G000810 [Hibiscus cannabinus]
MTENKIQKWEFVYVLIVITSLLGHVVCQDDDEDGASKYGNSSAANQLFSKYASDRFSNLSTSLKGEIREKFSYCITDVYVANTLTFILVNTWEHIHIIKVFLDCRDADWNEAFNFSKNPRFLASCARKNRAEIKFYFSSFYQSGGEAKKSAFLKPNKNCNLTSWVPGCEPGWACSAGRRQKVNLKDATHMPFRVQNCSACCEGFFCPRGITCMIPCPLGAYCPLAKLNTSTGACDPYNYQLPPGNPDHKCGGADTWADVMSSGEMFCSGGSYCPSTIQKIPCSKGYYCRTGSTSQLSCFRFATCNPKSENQNITAYGIMLFAGLGFLIVIIYNCSDQVLATREKKKEQSREKAVQSVRETAQAREKWNSAKEIAKKHAIGLQASLSRTFSRKKSQASQAKPGADAAVPLGTSQGPKKKEKGNLTKMLHEIEDNPESHEGFNIEIGDKQSKKNPPKGKELHTQSQMFRYAYGQIEKEKALHEQNKNLTFSGVISMAHDVDTLIRKRFTIEVAFKDLTITLKGKNIHLMRCVTGKLSPGRVSAVMGPSGAGKTTFLSALTGKAPGCIMTGTVQINGKEGSIQAYKKIIGFVPQDDIVHGNLTVAENLWFSARCRLAADLPKQEKVLVVERVIESLGLQGVRDSLVGTVEKRGISGGQRKRVNVGLEMVMEPSLLILDEPTSGLDSSSSQLLLRALRREALEGVNICMVVHQPSYTLYRMFDDLILLAKGGLTVYHGPVKKAEEYFSGLGITLPDRANPPDYFIDILEGIIKLNTGTGLTIKQLPVRWMLHNGYPVPMDMLDSIEGMSAHSGGSGHEDDSSQAGSTPNSFAGDLWQDVKCSVQTQKDRVQHNILSSADLSRRQTPGVFTQYRYYLGRLGKQRLRDTRTQVVDYLILLLAGLCLGTLAEVSDETFGATGYTYTVIGVSLLCKIAALRTFGLDKLHYWRERSSGMSSLAYFLAKDTTDHFNTVIKPLVYLSMFYFFNNPRSSVTDNYFVLLCLVYCVTGIAYIFSILFEPGQAQLWSVLLPVVLTLIATQGGDGEVVNSIGDLCYTKWALEAFVVSNAKMYSGVWLITRCGSLFQNRYDLKNFPRCLIYLVCTGVLSRIVAFICLSLSFVFINVSSSLGFSSDGHPDSDFSLQIVSMLQKMPLQEEKMLQDGPSISTPDFLPPRMKELLAELAMVEGEIARLESQISQLKLGLNQEHEATQDKKFKQWQPAGDPSTIANKKKKHMKQDGQENVVFETKALHFISKAIQGDYTLSDFLSPNDRTGNTRVLLSDQRENKYTGEVKFQERTLRKNGLLKASSPVRSPKPREQILEVNWDLPPKSPSSTFVSEENGQAWHPNKLSENIMKCLNFIFVRLLRTSRAMELEKSGTVTRSTNTPLSSRSFKVENTLNLNSNLQKKSRQQDPYGIFDVEESIPRDIGPYKNLAIFTSSSMDLKSISTSSSIPLLKKLRVMMSNLQKVDLRALTYQQKLAFWINMYNACIMHGYLQYGLPNTCEDILAMTNKATLNIGGNTISAQAMEHQILRKPTTSNIEEAYPKGDDQEADVCKIFGLGLRDRNVTFALCCGTRSSPAVRIYTGDGVSVELEKSKVEYLQASIVVTKSKKIAFPELLLRNMFDFAVDMNSLVQWVCQQLPTSGSLRKSMVDCLRNHKTSSISVEKTPYDFEFQYLLAM